MFSSLLQNFVNRHQQSPEFWVFSPGASSFQIQKLQQRLGFLLPPCLTDLLKSFNGGFVSLTGKVDDHPAHHASASHRFLSISDIEFFYHDFYKRDLSIDIKHQPPSFVPFFITSDNCLLFIHSQDSFGRVWRLNPSLERSYHRHSSLGLHSFELIFPSLEYFCSYYYHAHSEGELFRLDFNQTHTIASLDFSFTQDRTVK